MEKAANGIIGLETAAGLGITELVNAGVLTPLQWAACMSTNPAKVLGIPKGSLQIGRDADVVLIDPQAEYHVDAERFYSKSKNSPYGGRRLKGRVMMTILSGKIVYEKGEIKV